MLLFDVSNERSFINIRHWSDCLNDCLTRDQRNLPLVVCGTKADLRPSSEHQGLSCVQPIQAQRLAAQMKAQYIETSAKTGSNVLEALVILTRSGITFMSESRQLIRSSLFKYRQMMIMQDDEVQTSGLRLTDRRSILNCCSRNWKWKRVFSFAWGSLVYKSRNFFSLGDKRSNTITLIIK